MSTETIAFLVTLVVIILASAAWAYQALVKSSILKKEGAVNSLGAALRNAQTLIQYFVKTYGNSSPTASDRDAAVAWVSSKLKAQFPLVDVKVVTFWVGVAYDNLFPAEPSAVVDQAEVQLRCNESLEAV